MRIETERFGALDFTEKDIITFNDGLPGFLESKRFVLVGDESTAPIEWMQCIDIDGPVLPVIRSFAVLLNYDIEIPDAYLDEIGLLDTSDLLVLSVVVIPDDIERMTANLIAPVLINVRNGMGKQVIIDARQYGVREPVFRAIMAYVEGGVA